jgi:hypothetical protein
VEKNKEKLILKLISLSFEISQLNPLSPSHTVVGEPEPHGHLKFEPIRKIKYFVYDRPSESVTGSVFIMLRSL